MQSDIIVKNHTLKWDNTPTLVEPQSLLIDSCELTLLMPCLNESESLAACIQKAQSALDELSVNGEILIADNGSTDGSQNIAIQYGARVINVKERGYGAALREGILASRGALIIMGDADDSYDWSSIKPIYNHLLEGIDLVMGCRFPSGGGTVMPHAMPWLHKWIGNPVLSMLGRLFFKTEIKDFHCGLRGFSKTAISRLHLQTNGMEFASEMIIKAAFHKLSIAQVPIILHPDKRSGCSHLNTWRDGWRHLKYMLMFSPQWLFFYPGLCLMALGLIGFFILIPGPLKIGHVGFDVNTMLISSGSFICGFQCIMFWITARLFGIRERILPKDPFFEKFSSNFHLETGILCGAGLTIAGIILLLIGLLYWGKHEFGSIPYGTGLRIIIPSVSLITIGVQFVFNSFFISFLCSRPSSDHFNSGEYHQ